MAKSERPQLGHTKRAKFSLSESSEDPSEYSIQTQYTQYTDLEEDTDGENRDTVGMLYPKLNRSQSVFSTGTIQSCSNMSKCEEVIKSYTKLKIYFTVLCVVNIIIILLVCVFFAVFFIRLSNTDHNVFDGDAFSGSQRRERPKNTVLPSPEAQKQKQLSSNPYTIPCVILRHRLNASNVAAGKTDCGMEDLLSAFVQFAKPREYNEVLHLVKGAPEEPHDSHTATTEHDLINWIQDGQRSTKQGIEYIQQTGIIIIPSDGFYFVYSRVAFSAPSRQFFIQRSRLNFIDIQHSIRRKQLHSKMFEIVQDTSIKCTNHSFVHSSYLQRALFLRGGDELKVTISQTGKFQSHREYDDENYFGVFRL